MQSGENRDSTTVAVLRNRCDRRRDSQSEASRIALCTDHFALASHARLDWRLVPGSAGAWLMRSRDDLFNDVTMDIGQAAVDAVMADGQSRVVDAE